MTKTTSAIWKSSDVILEQYEVTGILGQGGMGTVYQVYHRGWKTDLAMKTPKAEVFTNEGGKANFIREAETWVNLNVHPNIVSCYYVRTIEEIPCLFAEYVPGGSLASWIRSRRLYEGGHQQALARMLDVSIQFAWGLHAAHEQGLVHQDVKPANVMLTLDGSAKVTDFGLAQARAMAGGEALPGATADQSILVSGGGMTPAYCSPEQAAKQPLGRKTDIWSWAVSVLQMFNGAVTWLTGAVASGALANYLHQGAVDPRIPAMPADLADLLRHCFQPRPGDRPATMAEVAEALLEIYQREVKQPYPHAAPRPAQALAATLNNRALSLYDLGKIEEAKQVWAQALEADPRHPEATYNQGLILWREAELTDEALVHRLEEVRATQRDQWQPVYLLALVHLERGDGDAALPLLEEAARRAPAVTEVQALWEQAQGGTLLPDSSLSIFHEHEGWLPQQIRLSADGRFALLPGNDDDQLRLWGIATGRCLRTFQTSAISRSLSADSRAFGSWCDLVKAWDIESDTVRVWDIGRGGNNKYPNPDWKVGEADIDTIRVLDVATGECLRGFRGHTDTIFSVSLSADGTVALSGSKDTTMRVWDVPTGRCLRIFPHPDPVLSVSLSADGTVALSRSKDTTRVWEVATGRCLRTFQEERLMSELVSLSADGKIALSGGKDGAHVWEIATGKCLRTFQQGAFSGSLSADGCFALFSNFFSYQLWEVATGRCLRSFQEKERVMFADGNIIRFWKEDGAVSIQVGNIPYQSFFAPARLSQTRSYKDLLHIEDQARSLLLQAEDALGKARFAGALDLMEQVRRLPGWERSPKSREIWTKLLLYYPKVRFRAGWLAKTFPMQRDERGQGGSVSLRADGRLALFFGSDDQLQLWEMDTGRCLRTFQHTGGPFSTCLLSADGHLALSAGPDDEMRLWEVATGRCLRTFQQRGVLSMSLSADGKVVLSGSADEVMMWDVATGRCLRTFQTGATVQTGKRATSLSEGHPVSLSADGEVILFGSKDGVQVWEAATGRCLRVFRNGGVDALSLSADGRVVLFGSHKRIEMWEVTTGRRLSTFQGPTDYVHSVSLSADGHWALSGSLDGTVQLWEVATGRCLSTFHGHPRGVRAVSLSADGHWALSGSPDGTARLWELDWELEARDPIDWDEGASPILETFLSLHTPYAKKLRPSPGYLPAELEVWQALTRRGKPSWMEEDFQDLIRQLQYAGYGWLRPEGVRHQLEKMAAAWPRRPRRISGQMDQGRKPASWWARLLRGGRSFYRP
jgi:WD40 repeat protein/serine/threonine protein kinase